MLIIGMLERSFSVFGVLESFRRRFPLPPRRAARITALICNWNRNEFPLCAPARDSFALNNLLNFAIRLPGTLSLSRCLSARVRVFLLQVSI